MQTIGRGMATGAFADFSAFSPDDPRISDFLIEQFPDLKGTVIEYIAGDDEDSRLESRFKNVIEGAGVGAAVETIMGGVKAARIGFRQAQKNDPTVAIKAQKIIAQEQAYAQERAADDDFMAQFIGTPDAPAVIYRTPVDAPIANAPVKRGTQNPVDTQARVDENLNFPNTPEGGRNPDASLADSARDTIDELPFRLNISRIQTTDDIFAAMTDLVSTRPTEIASARRGVRTWADEAVDAAKIDSAALVNNWKPGQALNAAQMTALRDIQVSALESFGKITQHLSQMAQNGQPITAAQVLAWKSAANVANMVTDARVGAAAETARALSILRRPAGSNAAAIENAARLVDEQGSLKASVRGIQSVADMLNNGGFDPIDIARRAAEANTPSRLLTLSQTTKLWNMKTQARNILGNTTALFMEISARSNAAQRAQYFGEEGVRVGEAAEMMAAIIPAFLDMARVGFSAARLPESGAKKAVVGAEKQMTDGAGLDAVIFQRRRMEAMQAEAGKPFSLKNMARNLANGLNTILAKPADKVLGAVYPFMQGQDETFKYIMARAELNAQAFRRAREEVDAGIIKADQAQTRIDDLLNNPTDDMIETMARSAEEVTFTRAHGTARQGNGEYGFGRAVSNARRRLINGVVPEETIDAAGPMAQKALGAVNTGVEAVTSALLPFANTPINLASYTFRSTPFAPLFGRYQADIAAGGARQQIAEARTALGSSILFTAFSLGTMGIITGNPNANPDEARRDMGAGLIPNSVRMPNADGSVSSYGFQGVDPLSGILQLGADLGALYRATDWGDQASVNTWGEMVTAGILATGKSALDKSSLSGLSNLLDTLGSKDPNAGEKMGIDVVVGQFFPPIVGQVETAMDPDTRAVHDAITQILSRTPGLSEMVDDDGQEITPVRYDLYGRPMNKATGDGLASDMLGSLVSPFSLQRLVPQTLDEAMQSALAREAVANGEIERDPRAPKSVNLVDVELAKLNESRQSPAKSLKIYSPDLDDKVNVPLDDMPEVYNYMLKMAGPGAEYDALQVIASAEYQAADASDKKDLINKAIANAYKPWREFLSDTENPDNPFRERLTKERDRVAGSKRSRLESGFVDQLNQR